MIKHPAQPVVVAEGGIHRFKANEIVKYLLMNGGIDMNDLAIKGFSDEDNEQFVQLIGYSVSGTSNMDYMTDEVFDKAMEQSMALDAEK
jgi:hypothetical protein